MTDVMDVRVRDRYVRKGLISSAEVDKHLEALPDVGPSSELIDYMTKFEEEKAAGELAAARAAAEPVSRPAPQAAAPAMGGDAGLDDDDDDLDDEDEDDAGDDEA